MEVKYLLTLDTPKYCADDCDTEYDQGILVVLLSSSVIITLLNANLIGIADIAVRIES